MKKLKTQTDKDKKNKTVKLLVGIFLAGIMVFSTVGYALVFGGNTLGGDRSQVQPPVQGQTGGPQFNGQYWVYNVAGQQYGFTHALDTITDVPVSINMTLSDYLGTPIYVVNGDQEFLTEIGQNIGRFGSRFQEACLGECEENLPEKDCSDNLIIYEAGEENTVYQEGKCIYIEGNLTAVDAFLYKVIGLS